MPTGYTADVVDGKVLTFEEFAQDCMRAFGATIHMRDEPKDKKYEPREPSDYSKRKLVELKEELEKLENTSNESLKLKELKRLKESIHESRQRILEKNEVRNRLENMLKEVLKWTPPTDDHVKFKEFMVNQLEQTIEWDTDSRWDEESIETSERRIRDIEDLDLRKEKEEELKDSIEYHEKQWKEELERCRDSNKWVEDLINSLDI